MPSKPIILPAVVPQPDEINVGRNASEIAAAVIGARAKRPSWDDVKREFPQAEFNTLPNGQVECRIRHEDEASKRRMVDMNREWRDAETAVGEKLNAEQERQMVDVATASGPRQVTRENVEDYSRRHAQTGWQWGYSRAYSEAEYWKHHE